MSRPLYKIDNKGDFHIARDYIDNKINSKWPVSGAKRSVQASSDLDNLRKTPEKLNAWCEKWLNAEQWTQLKNVIRATRRREKAKKARKSPINVQLTHEAHKILSTLAVVDGTMSDVIVKRLKNADYTKAVRAGAGLKRKRKT